MIRLLTLILLITGTILFFSCDAPRLNPLDPQGSAYSLGQVDGYVFSEPHSVLSEVHVTINNQTISSKSDSKGYYKISGLTTKDGILYFEKVGFKKDSIIINWNSKKNIRLDEMVLTTSTGQLDGYIYSYPHEALQGARATWKNQNISVTTNSAGYYLVEGASVENDGILLIEKEGFKKDSIIVQWNNRKNIRLDEKVLDYTIGQITGTVRAEGSLQKTLPGVKVFWQNQSLFTTTNQAGEFTLNNATFTNGWITFEIEDYSKNSIYVTFDNQREKTKDINNVYLNSIPKLINSNIYTSVTYGYDNNTKAATSIGVQVTISDNEHDVDSVFVQCAALNFYRQIEYNGTTKYYENDFSGEEIGFNSIEELIGKTFLIIAKDRHGNSFEIGTANTKRIIESFVQFISPANSNEAPARPTLFWRRFEPGYNFTYWVQIYKEAPISFVWEKSGISQDVTQYTVDKILPSGRYYWIIWCVDEFGNRSSSPQASFYIK